MQGNLFTDMCMNTLTDDKGNVDMHLVLEVILDVKRHIMYLQGLTDTELVIYHHLCTPFLGFFLGQLSWAHPILIGNLHSKFQAWFL